MFILDDYIENTTLQEELKNVKEQLKTIQDENAKLKTDIDLCRKADAEKTEKIASLSEELDILKYANLVLRTNAAECKLRLNKDGNEDKIKELEAKIETLENDRSELLAIHIAEVETINKLNIKARDLNGTISTLLERVGKSEEEKYELNKKVQELKDFISDEERRKYEWAIGQRI